MTRIGLALVVLSVCLLSFGLWPRGDAAAISGLCGTSHDFNSQEELDFIQQLQAWRSVNTPGQAALQVSTALNAAAAWFAQWQVEHDAPGGHSDGTRNWSQRAWDCGYTGQTSSGARYASGSGEGVWGLAGSGPVSAGPAQAIAGITYSGSGVWISTPSVSLPAKCVGAAVYRNSTGTVAAWVTIIAQYPAGSPCPNSTASVPQASPSPSPSPTAPSPTATATASATATATQSPSPSPSPSPTPTPTPSVYRSYAVWVTRED